MKPTCFPDTHLDIVGRSVCTSNPRTPTLRCLSTPKGIPWATRCWVQPPWWPYKGWRRWPNRPRWGGLNQQRCSEKCVASHCFLYVQPGILGEMISSLTCAYFFKWAGSNTNWFTKRLKNCCFCYPVTWQDAAPTPEALVVRAMVRSSCRATISWSFHVVPKFWYDIYIYTQIVFVCVCAVCITKSLSCNIIHIHIYLHLHHENP